MSRIRGEPWNWWSYRSNSGAVHVVFFDVQVAGGAERPDFQQAARVFLEADEVDRDDLPHPRERYLGLRDELLHTLESGRIACRLVGEIWHEGFVEFDFLVNANSSIAKVVSAWAKADRARRVSFEPVDDGAAFVREQLTPDMEGLEQINDRPLVERLLAPGVTNVEKEHLLEFEISALPTAVEAMAAELCRRDFVRIDGGEDQLVVGRKMRIDAIEIAALVARLRRYTKSWKADLTGWSTTPVK